MSKHGADFCYGNCCLPSGSIKQIKVEKISEKGVETVTVTGTEGGYNFEIVELLRQWNIEKYVNERKQTITWTFRVIN